jgi:Uncharacterized protein conserved in bacteria
MKYMLLMYADESKVPQNPEEYQVAAEAAGILVSNIGLSSVASATMVRFRDGKSLITDGPFAETHERLGGYFLLDCQDLDEAIRWAEKIPTAQYGSIEVRPV